jgi:hypothetical protein
MDCAGTHTPIDLPSLVHHLLVEQRVNVLDRTKCSTSARHIYNYLCGDGGSVQTNDNMSHQTDSQLLELTTVLKCGTDVPIVCYVHFHHLTNETSHYFIVVRMGTEVMVLQSAVFEFSIHDWLYPDASLSVDTDQLETARAEYNAVIDRSDTPSHTIAFDAREEQLARCQLDQHERDFMQRVSILESIRACRYSSGRVMSIPQFEQTFLAQLATLEGVWTEPEVDRNCETYQSLFACQLNRDLIRSHVRMGIPSASVKFMSANMTVATMGAPLVVPAELRYPIASIS